MNKKEKYTYFLDLSSSNTGVIILNNNNLKTYLTSWDFSKIKTDTTQTKTQKQTQKLQRIAEFLQEIKTLYPADKIYLEGIFVQPHFLNSSEILLKLHGIVVGIFCDAEIIYIAPSVIKKTITGKGNASKQQVQKNLENTTKTLFKNSDEADALALMYTVNPDFRNKEIKHIEKTIIR